MFFIDIPLGISDYMLRHQTTGNFCYDTLGLVPHGLYTVYMDNSKPVNCILSDALLRCFLSLALETVAYRVWCQINGASDRRNRYKMFTSHLQSINE